MPPEYRTLDEESATEDTDACLLSLCMFEKSLENENCLWTVVTF